MWTGLCFLHQTSCTFPLQLGAAKDSTVSPLLDQGLAWALCACLLPEAVLSMP